MASPVNVTVIAGGPSREAEVSRRSARGVHDALVAGGFRVRVLELDEALPAALASEAVDAVFPVTHGPLGEDGGLQGLLEVLRLPYVGSGVRGSAIAAHKPTAKVMFRQHGLPVADERLVRVGDDVEVAASEVLECLGRTLIVKPAAGGSAIGVTRLFNATAGELVTALQHVMPDDDALIERFHPGLEVTCGVLEQGPNATALPPTLIRAQAADWYDFQSRYQSGGSVHQCPAPLPPDVYARVQALAVGAHLAVGARDLSRVDMVVQDNGHVLLLEVNTLPGMTATSNYPEAAAAAGITFPELCRLLVERALARPSRAKPAAVAFPD